MMFWILAAAAVFVATLIALLPLFKGKTFWQPAALALIFLVPAASLWMYPEVGTPEAIGLAPPPRAETAPAAPVTSPSGVPALKFTLRILTSPWSKSPWMPASMMSPPLPPDSAGGDTPARPDSV